MRKFKDYNLEKKRSLNEYKETQNYIKKFKTEFFEDIRSLLIESFQDHIPPDWEILGERGFLDIKHSNLPNCDFRITVENDINRLSSKEDYFSHFSIKINRDLFTTIDDIKYLNLLSNLSSILLNESEKILFDFNTYYKRYFTRYNQVYKTLSRLKQNYEKATLEHSNYVNNQTLDFLIKNKKIEFNKVPKSWKGKINEYPIFKDEPIKSINLKNYSSSPFTLSLEFCDKKGKVKFIETLYNKQLFSYEVQSTYSSFIIQYVSLIKDMKI